MHSRHADSALPPHERGEQAGAAGEGNLQLLRRENFRIFQTDGRGINDEKRRGRGEIRRRVAGRDARAALAQAFDILVRAQIRTAHAETEIEQQMAEAAHAAAARADEMHHAARGRAAQDRADFVGFDAVHDRTARKSPRRNGES